jgi:hypothetical protein
MAFPRKPRAIPTLEEFQESLSAYRWELLLALDRRGRSAVSQARSVISPGSVATAGRPGVLYHEKRRALTQYRNIWMTR